MVPMWTERRRTDRRWRREVAVLLSFLSWLFPACYRTKWTSSEEGGSFDIAVSGDGGLLPDAGDSPPPSVCNDLPDLSVASGEVLSLSGELGYCSVTIGGTVEVSPLEENFGGTLVLRAAQSLSVLPTGRIIADGCGHPSDEGPGAGGCVGSAASGGGYGGAGGAACCDGTAGGPVYGAASSPSIEMGSGGGTGRDCSEGLGGRGGGAITLTAPVIIMQGELSADGTGPLSRSDWSPGGGSGGGILLMAEERIEMSGSISVSGGTPDPAGWGGGGGGGGRIKLFAKEVSITGALYATAGEGGQASVGVAASGYPGGNGTIHVEKR